MQSSIMQSNIYKIFISGNLFFSDFVLLIIIAKICFCFVNAVLIKFYLLCGLKRVKKSVKDDKFYEKRKANF